MAIKALEAPHGVALGEKPVVVTGASGGVGSIATALLAKIGFSVAVVTGRAETADYLKSLGATEIIPREELAEIVNHPLESERCLGVHRHSA